MQKKRIPCLQDIIISEINVRNETREKYSKWFSTYEESVNLFFDMAYLKNYCSDLNEKSVDYEFHYYAQDIYTELPCALNACSNLFETGHYTDALKCCRTMLETLVKLKFFYKERTSLSPYLKAGKNISGKFIKIKKFFENSAPNAYEKNYDFLCRFVHKGFATCLPSLVSRLKLKANGCEKQLPFLPLPSFNQLLAEVVLKHLLFLVLGYLNTAPFFLSREILLNEEVKIKYDKLKAFLENVIKENKLNFPNSAEWCQLSCTRQS